VIEFLIVLNIIGVFIIVALLILIISNTKSSADYSRDILVILKDLQTPTNPAISTETNAFLTDIGRNNISNGEALENVTKTSSIWEEDSLEGEEIEEVYGR
jgi:hypothetical protein